MLIAGWLETADNWLVKTVPHAEWLGLFGAAMAVLAVLFMAFKLFTGLLGVAGAMSNAAKARTAKASKAPGFRILMARPAGSGAARTGKWLYSALSTHLPVFAFGAPFSLVPMGQIVKIGLHGEHHLLSINTLQSSLFLQKKTILQMHVPHITIQKHRLMTLSLMIV